jgi:hypothetical protein
MRFKTSGAIWMAFARIFTPNNTPNYTHLLTAVKAPDYAHFGNEIRQSISAYFSFN